MSTAPSTVAPLTPLLRLAESPEQLCIAGLENQMERFRIAIEKELERYKSRINERFWKKLKTTPTGCQEYSGVKKDGRYGWMRIGSKCYYAHRIAAWLTGIIDSPIAPRNQSIRGFVLHRCDNTACCNPEHLWVGNASDNQLDCYKKGRHKPPSNFEYYHSVSDKQIRLL